MLNREMQGVILFVMLALRVSTVLLQIILGDLIQMDVPRVVLVYMW